ncbi:MAG: hypothetical protein CM15mP74_07310 [Halieaceae bacterium]|nr:MAG: hypothetical protein CM15mP74_07310 [Halieaceae bacterium]
MGGRLALPEPSTGQSLETCEHCSHTRKGTADEMIDLRRLITTAFMLAAIAIFTQPVAQLTRITMKSWRYTKAGSAP